MQNIFISKALAEKIPDVILSCIECNVNIKEKVTQLWQQTEDKIKAISESTKIDEISHIPSIAASRKAYKACGKDPARYRLSAEALLRRVVNRSELYQVNNVVDLLNLVSISTGFSIGGYDAKKINGNIIFGIGENNEPYEGIGRGDINIEFMPVFRDNSGAFGTPTSDSKRTSVSLETSRFLMIIVDYAGTPELEKATGMAVDLLREFADACDFELKTIKSETTNL